MFASNFCLSSCAPPLKAIGCWWAHRNKDDDDDDDDKAEEPFGPRRSNTSKQLQ